MLRCSKRDAAYDQTGPHGVLVVDGCSLTAGPSEEIYMDWIAVNAVTRMSSSMPWRTVQLFAKEEKDDGTAR